MSQPHGSSARRRTGRLDRHLSFFLLLLMFLNCCPYGTAADPAPLPNIDARLTYEQQIRPIFREHCLDCHGATEEIEGGLDLRLVRFMKQGGDSGPAVEPGQPGESYLLQRVRDGEMPPGQTQLSDREIETLQRWIAAGVPTARPEPERLDPGLGITPEERDFWSLQPIRRPPVPTPSMHASARTPVDAFLLRAMPKDLAFAPEADRATLIKRLYFDLLGLPPSPEELSRWLAEPQTDWHERLVEELLDSPHYGEQWARHWLDVAGYADSEGATVADADRPWAWRYRDYVVHSLNADLPFDEFIVQQLAGDELAGPLQGDLTPRQIELLTATGFLRMAADGTGSGANDPEARNRVIADTLKILSTSLLGLSVACAQCHDHRYDPIPQTDYYALRAILAPVLDWQNWKTPRQRLVSLYTQADRQEAAEIEAEAQEIIAEKNQKQQQYLQQALEQELQKFDEPLRSELRRAYQTPDPDRSEPQKALLAKHPSVKISPGVLYQYLPKAAEELKKYDQRVAEARAAKPPEAFVRALVEPVNHHPETHLFHRGDFQQPKQVVLPAALTVAAPPGQRCVLPANDATVPTTGRRLAFARWLTNGRHPLVARVIVNRIWLHHFGRGIVETPADFGRLGSQPTHPQLLDWLADEFMRHGWSLKQLHRLLLNSAAWRQSSIVTDTGAELDPDNRFYSRRPVLRLTAEGLRDRVLATTGQLDRGLYGAPTGLKEEDTGQVVEDGKHLRRSLYIRVRRTQPVALLQAFDAPVMETNCERRPVSTVATQSLMLMNGSFLLGQAAKMAERVIRETEATTLPQQATVRAAAAGPEASEPTAPGVALKVQINRAWELAYCRIADDAELKLAEDFLNTQTADLKSTPHNLPKGVTPERQSLISLCQTLLSSNEFLYVD